jgi:hypothetical protein
MTMESLPAHLFLALIPMTSIASTSHPSDSAPTADHLPSRSSKALLASTWQVLDQVNPLSFYIPRASLPILFLSSLHRRAFVRSLVLTACEAMATARC